LTFSANINVVVVAIGAIVIAFVIEPIDIRVARGAVIGVSLAGGAVLRAGFAFVRVFEVVFRAGCDTSGVIEIAIIGAAGTVVCGGAVAGMAGEEARLTFVVHFDMSVFAIGLALSSVEDLLLLASEAIVSRIGAGEAIFAAWRAFVVALVGKGARGAGGDTLFVVQEEVAFA